MPTTTYLHDDCDECIKAGADAEAMAAVTGSRGAKQMRSGPDGDHVAKFDRSDLYDDKGRYIPLLHTYPEETK